MISMKLLRGVAVAILIEIVFFGTIYAAVTTVGDPLVNSTWFQWGIKNWPVVALVLSEIAGVVPGKVSGVLSFVLHLGNAIFKKSTKP